MTGQACADCFYMRMRQTVHNADRMACCRYGPGKLAVTFPTVLPEDWCGEWRPHENYPNTRELAKAIMGQKSKP